MIQSLTLPPLIRLLGDPVKKVLEHEELVARMMATSAAIKTLEALKDPPANSPEVKRVRADFLERIALASREALGDEDAVTRGRAKPEDAVRRIAIAAERKTIVDLRDKGELSEEVFRRIERDFDLEESRLEE